MMIINEIKVKSILTKTKVPAGDYACNPYGGCPHKCMYCYADFMRRFTGHAEPWGAFLDVKRPGSKLNVKRLAGKKIIFSSVTDPYNPFEKKYRATRQLLEQFASADAEISVLTKSDLLLRDIDIFKQIPHITVGVSLCTLDDSVRKELEPAAASIEKRLAAVKALRDEGIPNYIFLSPMFPGITNFKEILDAARPYTDSFWFENLNLRGAYRPKVLRYIGERHPHLIPLYDGIYRRKDTGYWRVLEGEIADYCAKHRIDWKNYFYHEKIKKR